MRWVLGVLRHEARVWGCLVRWPRRRHRHPAGAQHYGRNLRPLLVVLLGMLTVEAVVVEVVLAVAVGHGPWVWVALGPHLYALGWLAGLLGALSVRPHLVGARGLLLRDGASAELLVPYAALTGVRTARRANTGRSGLRVDAARGTALLAYGDANVVLDLCQDADLTRDGEPYRAAFTELAVTADDPRGFLLAVRQRCGRDGGG